MKMLSLQCHCDCFHNKIGTLKLKKLLQLLNKCIIQLFD